MPEERYMTIKELTDDLNQGVKFPGLTNSWTMPIKTSIDMLSTGIKTPVVIKIMGPDLGTLAQIGETIEVSPRNQPGILSIFSERVTGGNHLDLKQKKSLSDYFLCTCCIKIKHLDRQINFLTPCQGIKLFIISSR